jgi:molecular chaperone GrpE (heat shock protein)
MLTSNLIVPSRFADASAEPGPAGAGWPHTERMRTGEPGSAESPPVESDAASRQAALRALRNLEATEARLVRNATREAEEARGKLVQELLPVLDNLDRTIHAAQAHRGDPAMIEGVRMVRQQLEGVLRGYGVERVDAVGQPFDPNLHEAIGVTAVGEPARNGVVVYQAEPGYRLSGRLLRPAKVNVGKLTPQAHAASRPLMW